MGFDDDLCEKCGSLIEGNYYINDNRVCEDCFYEQDDEEENQIEIEDIVNFNMEREDIDV